MLHTKWGRAWRNSRQVKVEGDAYRVLLEFWSTPPGARRYVAGDLQKALKMRPARIYRALDQLIADDDIRSGWEEATETSTTQTNRRRYYQAKLRP